MKLILLTLVLISLNLQAEGPTKEQSNPSFIVHLLDYLAGDYGGAVQNGKIVSKDEYSEQVEFIETVNKLATTLPEVKKEKEVVSLISTLKLQIENKADAKLVATTARQAQSALITALKISVAPERVPSFENGKKLYALNCISCHGQ